MCYWIDKEEQDQSKLYFSIYLISFVFCLSSRPIPRIPFPLDNSYLNNPLVITCHHRLSFISVSSSHELSLSSIQQLDKGDYYQSVFLLFNIN